MNPVIKGASYVLVNAPDMIIHNGTTQTLERETHPDSEYLKELPKHIREFKDVVEYPASQTYIGNYSPEELGKLPKPWFEKNIEGASRFGKFGEVMPQDEFYGLMKVSDAFDLVLIEKAVMSDIKAKFEAHPLLKDLVSKLGEGFDIEAIEKAVNETHAEALYIDGKLIGCVKRAHEFDKNLTSHIICENLVVKASGILAALNLFAKNPEIKKEDIDYIIECSEEACGDMNQRGGGNFAKAIGEIVGTMNATGSDVRGFCAAPTHAMIYASALVASGMFKNVMVVAGGASAKLGMNGKDHVKKGMPVLEEVIGGFAVLVSENDGINPIIRTDAIGRHTISAGASPQAVMEAIVEAPLTAAGLSFNDIDVYGPEMQNPEMTEPAGAGDVPTANYKMIGALAVKKGQLEKAQLKDFFTTKGWVGFAPTQGHIPSGAPVMGFGRERILSGDINRFMVIGKGSLFLGRMTRLFDGVSFIVEKNPGTVKAEASISREEVKSMVGEAMKDFASYLLQK
ncbi:glycine/sarcosine/betaine reductase complex component C subunit beta [Clostridium cylindrosporum]|uniref:Glycine/sarcosine/betaine reductase complex component C subunit beta n=1 Tax=Clostridium cylindrosporum DSM 605 TaxID=1121307 RepID=A0A0J8D952_CLOCY|nr:glycine/sarcosine/betaine reductase complex component C subunit beta [Clostridium cylindrosporum]KMT20808.1 glycine/sarcosine/betaine reductase complex component C subunit beta [Clostridium cylindrosporum DSM 605]